MGGSTEVSSSAYQKAILDPDWNSANTFGLINGGTGGLIWTYIGTFIGFFAAIASMAEMASQAPTTGGQYHWVSEFAPRSAQRIMSYLVGELHKVDKPSTLGID